MRRCISAENQKAHNKSNINYDQRLTEKLVSPIKIDAHHNIVTRLNDIINLIQKYFNNTCAILWIQICMWKLRGIVLVWVIIKTGSIPNCAKFNWCQEMKIIFAMTILVMSCFFSTLNFCFFFQSSRRHFSSDAYVRSDVRSWNHPITSLPLKIFLPVSMIFYI